MIADWSFGSIGSESRFKLNRSDRHRYYKMIVLMGCYLLKSTQEDIRALNTTVRRGDTRTAKHLSFAASDIEAYHETHLA